MGVHITLIDEQYRDHPQWDFVRYAGDRELAALNEQLPSAKGIAQGGYEDGRLRPLDVQTWRDAILERDWPDITRPLYLLKLLEDGPNYGVYLSY